MPDSPHPTRRAVVRSTAFLPLQAVRGSSANSAVKVGLIGAGGRGTYDASIVAKDPNARITAICDIFPDRITRAKERLATPDAKSYRDLKELLASDVDAVIIATPVFLHPDHLEAAVKAGKHIYIEKPAGLDVAGCKKVIRLADSMDRKINLTFGFQQRYGPVYHKARTLVANGAIGPIRNAHAHWIKGAVPANPQFTPKPTSYEDRIKAWHVWKDMFGDILVETYCHGIDVLNWFLDGHPVKAYGTGGRSFEKRGDIMDHVNVTFTYSTGVAAALTGTQITPPFYRSVNEQFFGATGVIETAREYWTHHRGRGDATTEKSPRDITIDSLEAFIQRVQQGKPENTGVRSAESTLTAIMGQMAIEQKREVTWEEMMSS